MSERATNENLSVRLDDRSINGPVQHQVETVKTGLRTSSSSYACNDKSSDELYREDARNSCFHCLTEPTSTSLKNRAKKRVIKVTRDRRALA